MKIADLAGAKVALLGFGREGMASFDAITRRLPKQRLSVLPNQDVAQPASHASHPQMDWQPGLISSEYLSGFDVIVKSPGISPYLPPLDALDGPRLTSGSALWFAENQAAPTVCITGSKGKSTTASLTAHLLKAAGRRVELAGNIGRPLLALLDTPEPDHYVIELSSYQTHDFGGAPALGCCLNLYPEHLTWHLSESCYYADKLKIFGHAQRRLINGDQPELVAAARDLPGIETFHATRADGISHSPLLGAHNRLNLAAALSMLDALAADVPRALSQLHSFKPLPHRLALLGALDGVRFVDDSIATTPHATLAALACFEPAKVVLLVGGFDRGLDWQHFARAVAATPPKAIICSGQNGAMILEQLRAHAVAGVLDFGLSFDAAVARALELCTSGDTLLLSPGAPSFDAFSNYQARGARFAQRVGIAQP